MQSSRSGPAGRNGFTGLEERTAWPSDGRGAGIVPGGPSDVYPLATPLEPDAELAIDGPAAAVIHGWFDIPDHVDYLSFRPSHGIMKNGWVNPTIAPK